MSAIAEVLEPKQQSRAFKHIVMAADFSDASERALAHAVAIAGKFNAELALVHAIAPEPREPVPMDPRPREMDRERIEAEHGMQRLELEMELKALGHRTVIERGSVWSVLSSLIDREHPDLLVLGTHGRGAVSKIVLGSVAEEVLRLAPCPVFTVGPKAAQPAYPAKFNTILFATDFGPACKKAFSHALALAQSSDAKLVLLHVTPPITGPFFPAAYIMDDVAEYEDRMREEGLRKLKELVPADAELKHRPEFFVATDFLSNGILDFAGGYHADLIVLGIDEAWSPRLAAHMPGVVIHDILCRAHCPVLTIKK